jgi:hypothetical protein
MLMCVYCRGDSPGAGGDRQYITEFVCEPDAAADTSYRDVKAQVARSVLNLVVVAAAGSCCNPTGVTSTPSPLFTPSPHITPSPQWGEPPLG